MPNQLTHFIPADPKWKAVFHDGKGETQLSVAFWGIIQHNPRDGSDATHESVGFVAALSGLAPAESLRNFKGYVCIQ